MLKEKYGKKDMLISMYMTDLAELLFNKDKGPLSKFFVSLQTQLQSLESLGVKSEESSQYLVPMIVKSLPKETLTAWFRSPLSKVNGGNLVPSKSKLECMLEFLKDEVESEWKIEQASGEKEKKKGAQRQASQKSPRKEEVATAAGLFASSSPNSACAHRTVVRKDTIKSLNLKSVGAFKQSKMVYRGGVTAERLHHNYQLRIADLSGRNTRTLLAHDEEEIVGFIPRIPRGEWMKQLTQKQIRVSDLQSNNPEIEILVGNDYEGMLMTGHIESLDCGVTAIHFSCFDGTCIPLESVCNSVRNCLEDTDSDEHDVLCDINRTCGGDPSLHQCNLGGGGCISKQRICDGVRDCDQGSDESPILCNREIIIAGSRSSRHISKDNSLPQQQHCPSIHESDGVQIEYVTLNRNALANCTFIPEGTFAISKCKPFHKSTQIQSRLEQQCNEDGKWSDANVKMQCEPDCGIINEKITFSGTNFTKNDAIVLPWHTLLFNLDRSTQKIKFACGATIISTKYLITAGSCFEPNAKSRSADIALIKLKRPLPFGALIRPACFLDKYSIDNKIAALPNNPSEPSSLISFAQTGLHIHNFPSVAEMACVTNTFGVTTAAQFQCVGHKQGNSVRQVDTGGAFVTLTKTRFGSRYSLKGVMSYEEIQDSEPISHFTSVEKYRAWIAEIIAY
ncbi:Prothrombin [Folsomia candida]|uniref:Prothrombin n=1 Tax=Folsomia candida TaxID=158441 RepID=A0A226DDN2_FOLCA|nr:Prothrombin [Folsomia candida]